MAGDMNKHSGRESQFSFFLTFYFFQPPNRLDEAHLHCGGKSALLQLPFEMLLSRYVYVCSVAKSHSTVCDPIDYSTSGSSVHGILQARILDWVDISSCRGSSLPRGGTSISCTDRRILYH